MIFNAFPPHKKANIAAAAKRFRLTTTKQQQSWELFSHPMHASPELSTGFLIVNPLSNVQKDVLSHKVNGVATSSETMPCVVSSHEKKPQPDGGEKKACVKCMSSRGHYAD